MEIHLKAVSFNPVTIRYIDSVSFILSWFLEKQNCVNAGTFVPTLLNMQAGFS